MKKFIKVCLIIIILGIIINVVIIVNRRSSATNKDKNSESENKGEIVVIGKDESQNSSTDYYSIYREKLDRPILYTIGNTPDALPQSGIYGADFIYEIKAEGGLTRLLAIFERGNVSKIGPIRSARHNFLDISMEYDAIFSHFGGSPKAFSDISDLSIPSLNGIALDGLMYWRDKARIAPHNAYTSVKNTIQYAKEYSYDKIINERHFEFYNDDTELEGDDSKRLEIEYSAYHKIMYEYDEDNKVYKRFMNGKEHIDDQIDSQLYAKNIIIQCARHYSVDSEDRQDISLVGSGMGFYFTNGKYINVTWKKDSRSDKTRFIDNDGNEIKLNKGQTWIQIVPLSSRIKY